MDIEYINEHTIFRGIVGSQAYGTSTPESDQDEAGIMIPGKEFFYGLKKFEQFTSHDPDIVIYNFTKAINLIADNNPNMMDLLFLPERCVLKTSKPWQKVIDNSNLFISKRCKYTYSGYAMSQLHRIKTHRKYLLDPPKQKPERKDYNLPDQEIINSANLKSLVKIQSCFEILKPENSEIFFNELDGIYGDYVIPLFTKHLNPDKRNVALAFIQEALKTQLNTLKDLGDKKFISSDYFEIIENELRYYNALQEFKRYEEWKLSRNKKRAPMEEKIGYDAKHAMHLIRLMSMGYEILSTGKVNVDRTGIDAEFLKEIRNGSWKFEAVEDYANQMEIKLSETLKFSTLQDSPNREAIDNLCVEIIDKYLQQENSKCNCCKCFGVSIDEYYKTEGENL